jgi:hypothetical protein
MPGGVVGTEPEKEFSRLTDMREGTEMPRNKSITFCFLLFKVKLIDNNGKKFKITF